MNLEKVTEVLNDPLAQELLHSSIPARLAYAGSDGSPRAIPIGFHWNGTHFVVCTVPHAPKVPALAAHPKVALTIDTDTWPPHVLLVRGTASVEVVDGIPPEYLEGARKLVPGQQWEVFEAQVRGLYKQMARIAIVPSWAKLLDFQTRIPSPIEQLIRDTARNE
ncbi:MAG TPA: pyridoxamine 5'-phosphate oxidase family protein [Streptosporangiaceae bacterium]|nr:pyridoxamine 5'-phosphate oxidase family protein [Streptosporangiaceae bacterium]